MANQNLQKFIQELPAGKEVKQELLRLLESGQEETVKAQIVNLLKQTGLKLSATEALDKAEGQYSNQLKVIEKEASNLVKAVSQSLEQEALANARQAIK